MRRISIGTRAGLAGAILASACAPAGGAGVAVPPLAGIVDFGYRKVQVDMNEVAMAATVSLIDAGANRTIATTVTDNTGRFLLDNFGAGFAPGTKAYYLEAVKGLSSNVAGVPAVRVRTIARFSGGWASITQSTLVVSRTTTALAIIASLRRDDDPPVAAETLIGKLQVGLADDTAEPSTPDTFDPAGTNVSNVEFHRVFSYADAALKADQDPIASVTYSTANKTYTPSDSILTSAAPVVSSYVPPAAGVGGVVRILGDRFATSLSGNTVKFGAVEAEIRTASRTELQVEVPVGAVSGPVSVETNQGISSGPPFTVISGIAGGFVP